MSKSLIPSRRTLLSTTFSGRTAASTQSGSGLGRAVQQQRCRNLSISTPITRAGMETSTRRARGNGLGMGCLQAGRGGRNLVGRSVGVNGNGGASLGAGVGLRGYKTVQEAKSRYKSGVCPSLSRPSSHLPFLFFPPN